MDRKVKVWNGSPEENGICRLSSSQIKDKLKIPFPLDSIKQFHQGTNAYECILAEDPEFKKYACLTFDDIGVLYGYIEKLIYQCKEWKK
jgi:hypothetical protein